jgi:predicted RNase H-like HicB family nuclease
MYGAGVNLHVAFEPDEQDWVRATIEELPSVITCAPTLDEARELVPGALQEWLTPLTSAGCLSAGHHARREALTVSVAWV